jgi:predicted AAA+ superfamily ATPase
VMLLGSAPLLVQRGLTESLAGRFELIRVSHWSYGEMRDAFGWSLDQYLFFGGYPGAAALIGDEERWAAYILDSLVETTLSRDILLLNRVDKPGLLRQLVRLGFERSGDVLSYNRMLGMLRGAGNTVTLAHYLDLLSGAGMLTGLPKYTAAVARQRGSSPRLLVLNTALIGASSGLRFAEAQTDPALTERLARSAVGAQLVNSGDGAYRVCYWREANSEVDFVVEPSGRGAGRPLAIEVRTAGRRPRQGLAAFERAHRGSRKLIVGPGGVELGAFLAGDPRELLAAA